MKLKDKEVCARPKKFPITILLYVAAIIVALLGIALLADNIFIFKTTVNQYVMQGYPAEDVMKSLLPAQLLPGIFEAVALYGGLSLALFGIGAANKKISTYLPTISNAANNDEKNNLLEDNADSFDEIQEIEEISQEEQSQNL